MKKIFLILAVAVVLSSVAWAKPYGEKSRPDRVGDIVFADGTATAWREGLTLTDAQKKAAVAVIFYVGTECSNDSASRTLGVGLKNTGTDSTLQWAISNAAGYSTNITAIQCTPSESGSGKAATATFTGDLDGSDNWQALCEAVSDEGTSGNYPAWEWVNAYATTANLTDDYANGWYLPTVAELCMLYREKDTVNAALKAAGGTEIADTPYWSSSQDASSNNGAWSVWFGDGYLSYDGVKDAIMPVCCVRAFNMAEAESRAENKEIPLSSDDGINPTPIFDIRNIILDGQNRLKKQYLDEHTGEPIALRKFIIYVVRGEDIGEIITMSDENGWVYVNNIPDGDEYYCDFVDED